MSARACAGAILALAVAAPAFPTAASAATPAAISVNRACYVRTGSTPPRMTLTGSGFVPDTAVTITDSTHALQASATAGADGTLRVTFPGPGVTLPEPGELRDTITAAQPAGAGALVASTTTLLSVRGAAYRLPRPAEGLQALTEVTAWSFSGWPVGRPVYIHYLVKGRAVARESFGRAHGPCGLVRARRPLYPAKPHRAHYRTQIDTHARYSPHASPRFTRLPVSDVPEV